jgi:hypothetical protein
MHKLTLHAKDLMGTLVTNGKIVGLVAGGAIVSQKFLDLKELATKFNVTIETGSTVEKILDHQGAIKVVGSMAALHFARNTKIGKNDMFKWIMVGVMLQGALEEVNQLTGDAAGQIGESPIDKEMREAAEHIKKNLSGDGQTTIGNPTTQYPTGVSGNPTTEYPTGVSGAMEEGTGVSGMDDDYSFLHGMGEEEYI